jgi:tRNA (cytidine/uridine-2'-O-)-methyltransferase
MFGKESAGLPEELLFRHKEQCVRIPMRDTLRSLNLSNSVAVAVYEVLRQTEFAGLREDGALTKYDWNDAHG